MSQGQTAKEGLAAEHSPEPGRPGFAKYVWISLGALVVIQGAVLALERSFLPSTVRPLHRALSELPESLGSWTGSDYELDSRTFATIGADQLVNRWYKNASGDVISAGCATWVSTSPGMPHSPEECYPGAGWELVESHTMALPGHPDARIALQTYRQSGQRVVLAFWFQMDDWTFVDWDGGRRVRRAQFGRRAWAPVTKTLLQIKETPDAEKKLLEIATPIYAFNCGL